MELMDGPTAGSGVEFTEGLVRLLIGAELLSLVFVAVLLCAFHHAYLLGTVRRPRAFRCPLVRREVEVEFLERWILGVRRSATAARCSAFETPEAIECRRACVDPRVRTRWEWALSVPEGEDARR